MDEQNTTLLKVGDELVACYNGGPLMIEKVEKVGKAFAFMRNGTKFRIEVVNGHLREVARAKWAQYSYQIPTLELRNQIAVERGRRIVAKRMEDVAKQVATGDLAFITKVAAALAGIGA